MNVVKKALTAHSAWIESLAQSSPPYSFNLLKIQASVMGMVVFGLYLFSVIVFGVFKENADLFNAGAFLGMVIMWVLLSLLVWLGQSDLQREQEREDLRFERLCGDPKEIKECFLADTNGGKTVLVVAYESGREESFFEGLKAIESEKKLKAAIRQ